MKNINKLFLLFVFCGTLVSAQKPNNKEILEVEKTIATLSKAMVDRDGPTLEKLTMEELTYGHSSGRIENKKQYIEAVVHGDFDFLTLNRNEQTIFLSGEDTAVVRHIFATNALSAGKHVDVRIGNMMVLKKHKNQWKVLARQAYKL
ncbi:nuclear transport factor 2 family protein [Aurantibacter sp.]|uniref:nuclear transport factor 2 family protein n=1 Tax=Aurantibacter sp. TaxID=2807103 RepID=UPI00326396FA